MCFEDHQQQQFKGLDQQQQLRKTTTIPEDGVTNEIKLIKGLQDQKQQQQLGTTIKCLLDEDQEFIPEDVVLIEIISKLPINCLIKFFLGRFEPSWSTVLFDFILRQLFRYDDDSNVVDLSDDEMIFILAYLVGGFHFKLVCFSYHNLAPLDGIQIPEDALSYMPSGSFNGLLVFHKSTYYKENDIGSWNLKTNSFNCAEINPTRYLSDYFTDTYGCGYCAQSGNLKVVRIRLFITYHDIDDCNDDHHLTEEDCTSWDGVDWDIFDDWFETERFFDAHDTILDMDSVDDWDMSKFSYATDDLIAIDTEWENTEYLVDIYSFSTASWKGVVLDPQLFLSFSRRSFFNPQKGFTKDTFSWLVVTERLAQVRLLTFHMTTEVFHVTSLPDEMLCDYSILQIKSPILFFNGTVGLAIPTPDSSCFEIWLLLEFGVMESWTRLCTVGPFPDVRDIIGLWKNGKVFLESTNGEVLVADLVTNQILQNLHIQVVPELPYIVPHLKT